jgi:hypothetical protein
VLVMCKIAGLFEQLFSQGRFFFCKLGDRSHNLVCMALKERRFLLLEPTGRLGGLLAKGSFGRKARCSVA